MSKRRDCVASGFSGLLLTVTGRTAYLNAGSKTERLDKYGEIARPITARHLAVG